MKGLDVSRGLLFLCVSLFAGATSRSIPSLLLIIYITKAINTPKSARSHNTKTFSSQSSWAAALASRLGPTIQFKHTTTPTVVDAE